MSDKTAAEYIKDRSTWVLAPDRQAADVQKLKSERGWGIYLLIDGYYDEESDAEEMRQFNQEKVEEMLRTEGVLKVESATT